MNIRIWSLWPALVASLLASGVGAAAPETTIRIDASRAGRPVSRYLTGACIEDVNHEIYGGLYSQMIFGESFQEPPRTAPVKGFESPDGEWRLKEGEVHGAAGAGPKLLRSPADASVEEAGVEILLRGDAAGNAGLILNVNRAGAGADNFDGYEISLDVARKRALVGRHQRDFRPLKETPVDIAADRWIKLSARAHRGEIEVFVDDKSVIQVNDPRPLREGTVGLRQWQRPARYRNLWVKSGVRRIELPFESSPSERVAISGAWGPVASGSAMWAAAIEKDRPFIGDQSQRVSFTGGEGEVGIENRGLNRWGMAFSQNKLYEGYVWLRTDKPTQVFASLESRDGSRTFAQTAVSASGDGWRRYDFTLTPNADDENGRFALRLKSVGSILIGHAFLQPGDWGRFKSLPVRRDVVDGLIEQGITVLRYGGSMVNTPEYRWKKMIGPRDRRPPYHGTWYPYSSNGWGILDFLSVCEAAGFLAIPDFNLDETPQDMAEFVEYVNGSAGSEWGRRRVADGHPEPYHLKQLELGNEEKVDAIYFEKFEKLATAIWAKDPNIILVVGDFQYEKPIADPNRVEGAASRVTSLAAHKKILELAKRHGREIWFDVHLWTEGPNRSSSTRAFKSYVDAIEKLADGAKHHVVVFEFNANNHDHRRALANAWEIGAMIRDGRVPVALSANCLQPVGQNDNGWDQGLLFLSPSKVWLQPPGYVTRMASRSHLPQVIDATVDGAGETFSATATRSEDGKRIVLQVVNLDANARSVQIHLDGYTPSATEAKVETLSCALDAVNTLERPANITPRQANWRHEMKNGAAVYEFAPHSYTVIQFE